MEKTLSANYLTLTVDLSGGRILELKSRGETVLGTFTRIDGKTGNTHLCLPNFGAEGQEKYNLPFHGYARTVNWETAGGRYQLPDRLTLRCYLPPTSNYPAELEVTQEFALLPDVFRQTVTVKNLQGPPVPVNIGIHNYWQTPAKWEGARLNGEDITQKIKDNGFSPLKSDNAITFSGGVSYKLHTEGFGAAVLWTGRKDGRFDSAYACIEPAVAYDPGYFGSDESLLAEKQTRVAVQEIGF